MIKSFESFHENPVGYEQIDNASFYKWSFNRDGSDITDNEVDELGQIIHKYSDSRPIKLRDNLMITSISKKKKSMLNMMKFDDEWYALYVSWYEIPYFICDGYDSVKKLLNEIFTSKKLLKESLFNDPGEFIPADNADFNGLKLVEISQSEFELLRSALPKARLITGSLSRVIYHDVYKSIEIGKYEDEWWNFWISYDGSVSNWKCDGIYSVMDLMKRRFNI